METQIILWGLVALALAAALVAGVFLTFSDFVMPSLFAAAPSAGTEAMQIINRKVYRSIFMVLLIGLIPVSALIAATESGTQPAVLPSPASTSITAVSALSPSPSAIPR